MFYSSHPGEIARELTVDESRPRSRGSNVLAELKTEVLESLDLNKAGKALISS
ncbi:hypothetical protein QNH23_13300 [Siminovitchia fortis]|uniref:hypothetical protein n=1 Tax=Siminovitchia fortis TaxID=254758 RepID=UPI001ABFB287|nr:hypothetical protein [Siminovitchia fortis]WHY80884.1 hypothetical protein QNH23_13300 [Siminovitchia fortis]